MPGVEPRRPFRRRTGSSAGPGHGSAAPQLGPGPEPLSGRARNGHPPDRPGKADEVALDSLNPDPFARMTLALLRWHFQTFAAPESQGWLAALRLATTHVGPRAAGPLCYDLVALVQALRSSRAAPFRFNPEFCACCRCWLTPEERQLMALVAALRRGRRGESRVLAQLLCDGTPGEDLLAMAESYVRRHAPAFLPEGGRTPAPIHPPQPGD
ncbi:MAG: hypothetical protein ACK4KW_11220 [Gemmobacter sp.]